MCTRENKQLLFPVNNKQILRNVILCPFNSFHNRALIDIKHNIFVFNFSAFFDKHLPRREMASKSGLSLVLSFPEFREFRRKHGFLLSAETNPSFDGIYIWLSREKTAPSRPSFFPCSTLMYRRWDAEFEAGIWLGRTWLDCAGLIKWKAFFAAIDFNMRNKQVQFPIHKARFFRR